MPKWNYSGDMNLEHGGIFWREDGSEDYVLAVEITPCSDGGGPDNKWVITQGSIYIPDDKARLLSALSMGGYTMREDGAIIDSMGAVADEEEARMYTVEMMRAYAGLENRDETVIQIGRDDPFYDEFRSGGAWNPEADIVLHGNTQLRRYVENNYLD